LYSATSLAGAVLELRANDISFSRIRTEYHYAEADLSDCEVETVPDGFFEHEWRQDRSISLDFGRTWLKELRTPVLRVRSAVLSEEWNCVLNVNHPEIRKVHFSEPKPILLDERL
jgi:RES domain-containing protein